MFSLFAFLAVLLSALPLNSAPVLSHSASPDFKVVSTWGIEKAPTPVEIANSNNENKPTTPPGQTISQIAHEDHPGGISEEVHEVIPGNKFYPTPIISPVPVTTDTPSPTPPVVEPSVIPVPSSGCPPCGGNGGKFPCIEIVCPL